MINTPTIPQLNFWFRNPHSNEYVQLENYGWKESKFQFLIFWKLRQSSKRLKDIITWQNTAHPYHHTCILYIIRVLVQTDKIDYICEGW